MTEPTRQHLNVAAVLVWSGVCNDMPVPQVRKLVEEVVDAANSAPRPEPPIPPGPQPPPGDPRLPITLDQVLDWLHGLREACYIDEERRGVPTGYLTGRIDTLNEVSGLLEKVRL